MKLFFIASAAYVLYLIKFKFKSVPHTPPPIPQLTLTISQTDTRSSNRHPPSRIPPRPLRRPRAHLQLPLLLFRSPLGLLHLPRGDRHSSPTHDAPTHRRGRDHHHPLPLCPRSLPCPLRTQLALPVSRFIPSFLETATKLKLAPSASLQLHHRRYRRSDRHRRRSRPNRPLFRLFLHLFHKVRRRVSSKRRTDALRPNRVMRGQKFELPA